MSAAPVEAAPATPDVRGPGRATAIARRVLPWLLSTVAHLALFVAIALNFRLLGGWLGISQSGPGIGKRHFIDTSFGVIDPDNPATLGMTFPVSTGQFYADDPPAAGGDGGGQRSPGKSGSQLGADSGDEPGQGTPTSGKAGPAELAALKDGPALSVAGLLPRSGAALGASGLEGGGVGSARGAGDSNRPSRGAVGGYARTGVFGVQGEGRKFVYVFDRSGSMDGHGGAPLAAAKSQLIGSLRDLGPTHQFQIIFYNEHPRVFSASGSPGKLQFANDATKALAVRFIEATPADGATEHEEALSLALRMGPDVIFFLTDADEPRLSSEQLDRLARLNRGTMINTIEFGYGPALEATNFLVQLARRNGGNHVYVDISKLPAMR